MTMKAYNASLYMIMFNFCIIILKASLIVGTANPRASDVNVLSMVMELAPSTNESLAYTIISISAFGLLVYTLNIMLVVFYFSAMLSSIFLSDLNLPFEFQAPLTAGVWIVYIIGYNQWKGRVSLKDGE